MKKTAERKAIQAKLNHLISDFVTSVTKADSKKIRKSIKKASKLVAKAISKRSDESELKLSLRNAGTVKKIAPVQKSKNAKKRTPSPAAHAKPKVVVKSAALNPVKTLTKAEASSVVN